MEAALLPYAILRNYENFPSFGHDVDLVLDRSSLNTFSELLREMTRLFGWDELRYCDHRSRSPFSSQNIESFHLYRFSPVEHLRLDVFHGILVVGLPVFTDAELLKSRRSCGNFTRLSPAIEAAMRILQIHSLHAIGTPAVAQKTERYRRKAAALFTELTMQDWQELERTLPGLDRGILETLNDPNLREFSEFMRTLRRRFLSSRFLNSPAATLVQIFRRALDLAHVFFVRPCGIVLSVFAPSDAERSLIRKALDGLVRSKCLTAWTIRTSFWSRFSWRERKLLERDGVIIQWSAEPRRSNLPPLPDSQDQIAALILGKIAARHEQL